MSRLHHVLLSVALLSAGCVSTWAQGGVVDLHDSTFEHDTQAGARRSPPTATGLPAIDRVASLPNPLAPPP